jgi:hypothetical protein
MFTKTRRYFLSAAPGIAGIASLAVVSAANAQMYPGGYGYPGHPGGYPGGIHAGGYPGPMPPVNQPPTRAPNNNYGNSNNGTFVNEAGQIIDQFGNIIGTIGAVCAAFC